MGSFNNRLFFENRWVFSTVISKAMNTHDPTVNRELLAGRTRITLQGK